MNKMGSVGKVFASLKCPGSRNEEKKWSGKKTPARPPGFLFRLGVPCFLSLVVLVLLSSGCAHHKGTVDNTPGQNALDALRSRVRQEIADPARSGQILALVDQMEKELDDLNRTVLQFREDYRRLNANYEATVEEFRKLIAESDMALRRSQQKLIETHFQIKALTTPQEWAALSMQERKAFEDSLKAHEGKAQGGM